MLTPFLLFSCPFSIYLAMVVRLFVSPMQLLCILRVKLELKEKSILQSDRITFFAIGILTLFFTLLFSFGIDPTPGCNILYGL
jgi:hypothetical protein